VKKGTTFVDKEDIISLYLKTAQGKAALAKAMISPLRGHLREKKFIYLCG
jgi:hypothetical protein